MILFYNNEMDIIKVEHDLNEVTYPICLLKEEQLDVKCEENYGTNSFSVIRSEGKDEPLDFSEDCDMVIPEEHKFCAQDQHGFTIQHLQCRANNNENSFEEMAEKGFKCEVLCSESLKIHVPTDTEEKPLTSAEFTQCDSLENPTDSGENSFICDVCGTTFTQLIYLSTHKCTHVQEKYFNSKIPSGEVSGSVELHTSLHKQPNPFQCLVFKEGFASRLTHISADTEESSIKCNTSNNKFTDRYKLETHTGKKAYKCDICGKVFLKSRSLTHHIRTHTGEKPFECNICGKTFSRMGHLKHHSITHTGEKPFMCDICAKAFSDNSRLKRHILTHTGEKSFKCNICGKVFSQNGHLRRHFRSHTGEKPYKCDICGKAFSEGGGLKDHIRTHNGEKPFKCDICERRFSTNGSLKHHMVTHTKEKPCKCDICGKSFSLSGNLTQHMVTHSREKRFKCDICGKGFSLSGALNRHILTHTGEKPFKCDICANTFLRLERLKHHMITHNGFQTSSS